jgi:hypothetical protein
MVCMAFPIQRFRRASGHPHRLVGFARTDCVVHPAKAGEVIRVPLRGSVPVDGPFPFRLASTFGCNGGCHRRFEVMGYRLDVVRIH